jgi:hypothetical protein
VSEIVDFVSRKKRGGGEPPTSDTDLDLQLHLKKQIDAITELVNNNQVVALSICTVLKGSEVLYPGLIYNNIATAMLLEKSLEEAVSYVKDHCMAELFGSELEWD